MKRSEVVKAIREVLDEMSMSGDAGGYSTPFAFSKKGQGKNRGTLESEKLGFKTVKMKKRPYDTKGFSYLDEMHMATPHMFISEEELYESEPVKRSEEMGMKLVHKNKKASDKKNK